MGRLPCAWFLGAGSRPRGGPRGGRESHPWGRWLWFRADQRPIKSSVEFAQKTLKHDPSAPESQDYTPSSVFLFTRQTSTRYSPRPTPRAGARDTKAASQQRLPSQSWQLVGKRGAPRCWCGDRRRVVVPTRQDQLPPWTARPWLLPSHVGDAGQLLDLLTPQLPRL